MVKRRESDYCDNSESTKKLRGELQFLSRLSVMEQFAFESNPIEMFIKEYEIDTKSGSRPYSHPGINSSLEFPVLRLKDVEDIFQQIECGNYHDVEDNHDDGYNEDSHSENSFDRSSYDEDSCEEDSTEEDSNDEVVFDEDSSDDNDNGEKIITHDQGDQDDGFESGSDHVTDCSQCNEGSDVHNHGPEQPHRGIQELLQEQVSQLQATVSSLLSCPR